MCNTKENRLSEKELQGEDLLDFAKRLLMSGAKNDKSLLTVRDMAQNDTIFTSEKLLV